MPLVSTNRLHKFFGKNHVLRGIKLDVEEGEVVTIVGRSGSGKSTLLRTLNGLESIDDGIIEVDGAKLEVDCADAASLRALRLKVGMVFQQFNLFPHLSAGQNVMLAPQVVKGTAKSETEDIARRMLERVGLAEKFDAFPDQLSGGQQQRVAVARAIVNDPVIILGDEPTGNLDSRTAEEIMALFQDLNSAGKTVILVTHEQDIAEHCKRIIRFRDGHIISDEKVASPADARQILAKMPAGDEMVTHV